MFNISFVNLSLFLVSLMPVLPRPNITYTTSPSPRILLQNSINMQLWKDYYKSVSSYVYHPWRASPWWTGSRQRVPWTTQQRSQQPTTQRISLMPNVKLNEWPFPFLFLREAQCTVRSYLEIPSPRPIHSDVTTVRSLQQTKHFPRSKTFH
jgi:hypothetical protein